MKLLLCFFGIHDWGNRAITWTDPDPVVAAHLWMSPEIARYTTSKQVSEWKCMRCGKIKRKIEDRIENKLYGDQLRTSLGRR